MTKMEVDAKSANIVPIQNLNQRWGVEDDADDEEPLDDDDEEVDDEQYEEEEEEEDEQDEDEEEDDEQDQDDEEGTEGFAKDRSFNVSDPKVLACRNCFHTLSIPVYQCDNGHFTCSACHNRRKYCITCLKPTSSHRCKGFEKVLESIKMSCENAKCGCKKRFSYSDMKSYSDMEDHKLKCIYKPCVCPDCDFVASYKELYLHFSHKHSASGVQFSYDQSFSVFFWKPDYDEYMILREKTCGKLFILHRNALQVGTAVHISSIGPSSMRGHCYEICARSGECNIRFNFLTKGITDSRMRSSSSYLLVPSKFFGSANRTFLEIRIRDNASAFAECSRP